MAKSSLTVAVQTALVTLLAVTPALSGQIDIAGPTGSGNFGNWVTVLPNGNFVVVDTGFDDGALADVGAVYLYDGTTLGIISILKGGTANDRIGRNGITVLANGNYVVLSSVWSDPAGPSLFVGAVTWCDGTTGCSGVVTPANSLVGSTVFEQFGASGITPLPNGNYLVLNSDWDDPVGPTSEVGAVTWCDGTSGCTGLVTSANSLVGGTVGDEVGRGGIKVLTNGNYVVNSHEWSSVGAVTWCDGTTGCTGLVTSANSLVGGTAYDRVGYPSNGGVTGLTNGNYVVRSSNWDDPTGPISDVGAVTWCDGTSGCTGLVTSANSLVGATATDYVGNVGITALTNGHYVVGSQSWNDPAGPTLDVGAATWCDGISGCTGLVTTANSLVGGGATDWVGTQITALTNGNYVVGSPVWNDPAGPTSDVGAVTWCDGTSGCTGLVTSANSLVGATATDYVGYDSGITALPNGNYVVLSREWDDPAGPAVDVGAATWCDGTSGCAGLVTTANSLVGGAAGDYVGHSGITVLTNGNYLVGSRLWNDPAGPTADVGALTWCDGTSGCTTGLVTTANSLVGGTVNERLGHESHITVLTNGNYVVGIQGWDDPAGPTANVGAVTWCDGTSGCTGLMTPANSLVGGTSNDSVGGWDITALTNGNYVVSSGNWDDPSGPTADVGAVTWCDGASGCTGLVTSANSLTGGAGGDFVGRGDITALTNGDYSVLSTFWDNPTGPIVDARAATLGDGSVGTTGLVSATNSVLGTVSNGISQVAYDATSGRLFAGRSASNIVSIHLAVAICGDMIIEGSEACDEGAVNGTSTSCCTSSCALVAASPVSVCRTPAGACDVAETCDGVSGSCPADQKSTAECRASAGVCDAAESCDGIADTCPADLKSTAECRASAGACDVAESCDGVADSCPADLKSTAECRADTGECDIAESCDGVGDDCPSNAFEPSGLACEADADVCTGDSCDGAGLCQPGSSINCDDNDVCTGTETCDPILGCQSGTPLVCDDADICTDDTCDAIAGCEFVVNPSNDPTCAVGACPAVPEPTCLDAAQGKLDYSEKASGKEKMKLQWKKITTATTQAEFGDPVGGSTIVTLCIYDDGDALVEQFIVDQAGQLCAGKDCWKAKSTKGYGYKDKDIAINGIAKIGYASGDATKGKADAKGKNNAAKGQTTLPTGVVSILTGNTAPMIQMLTSDGFCVGATMTEVKKDDGLQYKAQKK